MKDTWHPLGPLGVISAFNFPVAVWAWNAFIAAICGNTTIWKPSSNTPLTAIAVQQICNDVMHKNGYSGIFSIMIGPGSIIGEKLISDKRIPLISFTGSTNMGRHVSEVVGSRFGKCILELGGNNAMIIDETATLSLAVPAIVFGAVGTAGQRCTSTRRVIANENIYNDLRDQLVSAYSQVVIGDPLDSGTLMGPLINESAINSYDKALEKVVNSGGNILCGGDRNNQKGNFVTPVIAEVKNEWDIVQEETFAPILYLIKYKTIDDALVLQDRKSVV